MYRCVYLMSGCYESRVSILVVTYVVFDCVLGLTSRGCLSFCLADIVGILLWGAISRFWSPCGVSGGYLSAVY